MAPKKKGKGAARAASTPVADDDAMAIDSPATETPKPIEEPAKRYRQLVRRPLDGRARDISFQRNHEVEAKWFLYTGPTERALCSQT